MKKAKLYRGGRKNVRGEKQIEAEDGRQQQNRNAKKAFSAGPHARQTRTGGPFLKLGKPEGSAKRESDGE